MNMAPEHLGATQRIGVDIGRVITASVTDDEPSIFDPENFLLGQEMPGAIDTLNEVVVPRFGAENTFLVSKCGPVIQHRTSKWLNHINFYERTGILRGNVLFCLERSEKALIAARLGLTHMIDDRENVFTPMPDTVEYKLLFAPDSFGTEDGLVAQRGPLIAVNGWAGVRAELELEP